MRRCSRKSAGLRCRYNIDADAHQAAFEKAWAHGLRPVNVSVISINGERRYTSQWLRLQVTVEATGGGGLCRGDSGSPYLDGNVALAIHSGDVSHVCMGGVTNGTRLDTQNARDFLSRFLEP